MYEISIMYQEQGEVLRWIISLNPSTWPVSQALLQVRKMRLREFK